MNDGLKLRYKEEIVKRLSANPKVQKIVLFGSRANGKFKNTSDIDLALMGPELNLDHQAELVLSMEDTTIPQQVDIVIYHRIDNQILRDHIDNDGVLWFERKAIYHE